MEVRTNRRFIEIPKNTSSRSRIIVDPSTRIQASEAIGDRGESLGDLQPKRGSDVPPPREFAGFEPEERG